MDVVILQEGEEESRAELPCMSADIVNVSALLSRDKVVRTP